MPVIGYLQILSAVASERVTAAFVRGMTERGFEIGRNIASSIDTRTATSARCLRLLSGIEQRGRKAVLLRTGPSDSLATSISELARQHADVLVVTADPIFTNRRAELVALASAHRVAAIYQWSLFVAAGGLMSYGADLEDVYREAGHYTARVLKGEKPGDLPVQQPTKFQLSINMKVARDLDLTIPATLLALADEVID
jgi:putative ABC transport system substrate-binding protein